MPYLGVNIAILQGDKVLLTQREDFEVWCLPGGSTDEGESLADAARREAREETGLEVELTRLVGIYSRPNWHQDGSHIAVFAAHPVGGSLHPQPGEVIDIRYFSLQDLPEMLLFGQYQRIVDVLTGASGVVWTQPAVWPFPLEMTRQELYEQRDRSGLSRQEFYRQHFMHLDTNEDRLEVGT